MLDFSVYRVQPSHSRKIFGSFQTLKSLPKGCVDEAVGFLNMENSKFCSRPMFPVYVILRNKENCFVSVFILTQII